MAFTISERHLRVDVAGIEGVRKVAVELAYHAVIFFLPEIIQGKILSEKLPVIVIVGRRLRFGNSMLFRVPVAWYPLREQGCRVLRAGRSVWGMGCPGSFFFCIWYAEYVIVNMVKGW